jgi:acetyl esterase/lipase
MRQRLLLLSAAIAVIATGGGAGLGLTAAAARANGATTGPATTAGRSPASTASAAARQLDQIGPPAQGPGYAELTDLSYGADPAEVLDVYLPEQAGASARPGVVVIHGGGWQSGSRSALAPEAESIARAGMVAINIDYPLDTVGGHGFPAELSAAEAAVGWLRSHAGILRVDPSAIGALGASAGGNLSLELGAADQVSAVVAWSAPTDLAFYERVPHGPCTVPACGALSLGYAVYHYLGCRPAACPAAYAAASPETHLGGTHGSYMVWNSSDELVPLSQSDTFVSAARRAGLVVEERVVPGHGHAERYASVALASSIAFLLSHLS